MESYALVSKTLGHASHSAHCKHLSASTNPVMFTHQTPEPRYVLDPQGVSPHLRGQATPRQQPLRTQDQAPHTPSPKSSAQPLRQEPRSRGGGTQAVHRNAEATARLLRVSVPPLWPLPNSGKVSDSAPCARSVSLPLALGKWRRQLWWHRLKAGKGRPGDQAGRPTTQPANSHGLASQSTT